MAKQLSCGSSAGEKHRVIHGNAGAFPLKPLDSATYAQNDITGKQNNRSGKPRYPFPTALQAPPQKVYGLECSLFLKG